MWRTGREVKGNWQMEWVASTLQTTSEHGISNITTADAHNSATSSRQNLRPRRFKWTRPLRRKTKSGFCACAITLERSLPLHEYITSKMECRLRSTHPYNLDFSGRRMVRSALLQLYRDVRGCCEADLLCRMPGRSYASLTACVFKTMHKSLPETKPWSSRPWSCHSKSYPHTLREGKWKK